MATETELEAMIVRFTGDNEGYQRSLDQFLQMTRDTLTKVQKEADAMTASTAAAKANEVEKNKMVAEGDRVTKATQTATESYQSQVQRLQQMVVAGTISQETYNRALAETSKILFATPAVQSKAQADDSKARADAQAQAERMKQNADNAKLQAQRVAEAEAGRQKIMAQGIAVTRSVETSTESYSRRLKELTYLLNQGAISQETFDRAMVRGSVSADRQSSSLSSLTRGITTYIAAMVAIAGGGGVFEMLSRGVGMAANMESIHVSFQTLIGDVDKANRTTAELKKFADWSPFNTQEVMEGGKMLLAMKTPAEDLVKEMTMLGDIAGAVQVPIQRLVLQYGQLRVQGRVYQHDINQLTTAGIDIISQLSKNLGMAPEKMRAFIETGKVTFKDVEKALKDMTSEGGMFFQGMEKQSKTLKGLYETMKSEVENTLIAIGDEVIKNLDLKWLTIQIQETAKEFTQFFQQLTPHTKRFLLFTALAIAGILAIGAAVIGVMSVIDVMSGGLLVIVGLIVTAGAAFGAWASTFDSFQEAWKTISGAARDFYNFLKPLIPLFAALAILWNPGIAGLLLIITYWEEINTLAQEFWTEWKPILLELKQTFYNIAMVLRDDLAAGLEQLIALAKRAGDNVSYLWKQLGGASVDWARVKTGLIDTILYFEFAFNRIEVLADLAWAGIKYGAVVMLNELSKGTFAYFATISLAAIFLWISKAWYTILEAMLTTAVKWTFSVTGYMLNAFSDMFKQLGNIAEKAWKSILSGKAPDLPAIGLEALEELGKGIKDKFGDMGIDLKFNKLGGVDLDAAERSLKENYDKSKARFDQSFEEWKKTRRISPMDPEAEKGVEKVTKKVEDLGGAWKAAAGEIKKYDAVLFNSSEAMRARLEYIEHLAPYNQKAVNYNRLEEAPAPRQVPYDWRNIPQIGPLQGFGQERVSMQSMPGNPDGDKEKIAKLLTRIAVAVESQDKKPGATLKIANVNGG